jgi:hypothetical protein
MLSALSSEGVEFLLVGGRAVMVHTEPRYTKDLDLWVRPTRVNAARVLRALKKFGAPQFKLKPSELARPDLVLIIGVEPVRVDILTSIDGVDFDKAWRRRVEITLGHTRIGVLSPEDLLRNKERVGRPQDLVDVEKLRPVVQARAKKKGR